MSETKKPIKEKPKKEKKPKQDQRQLTYDPNNPHPFRKRVQLAIPSGEEEKKNVLVKKRLERRRMRKRGK